MPYSESAWRTAESRGREDKEGIEASKLVIGELDKGGDAVKLDPREVSSGDAALANGLSSFA